MAPRKKTTTKKVGDRGRDWRPAFLAALAEIGVVRHAAVAAEVNLQHAYATRRKDADFAEAWKAALDEAADRLEEEARRRAVEGVRRLKFHQGQLITIPLVVNGEQVLDANGVPVMVPYVEHEYSDTLLIFLLKGARPAKFRDKLEIDPGKAAQALWDALAGMSDGDDDSEAE